MGDRTSRASGLAEAARSLARSFDARYLGLAPAVPAMDVFRRISYSLPITLSQSAPGIACVALLAAGFLAAVLVPTAAAARGRAPLPRAATLAALTGVALAGAGMAAALGPAAGSPLAEPAVCASYLALGVGVGSLLTGWAAAFMPLPTPAVLVYVCLDVLLGNLLQFSLEALMNPWGMWALLFACLLASCAALASTAPRGREAPESGGVPKARRPSPGRPASVEDGRSPVGAALRDALTAPAVGLALGVFAWGVMAVPPLPFMTDHNPFVYLLGNLLALGVAVAFAYSLRHDWRYPVVRQKAFFLLPVFAVFLAYFSFIRMLDASGPLKDFLGVGYNISMPGLLALFLATACAQSREKGARIELVAGPALAFCALAYALGAALFEAFGNNAMYFQVVFTTLYILGLALISSRRAYLSDDSRLRERCELAARRDGLSQRELEVLQLVVADYSVERIAEQLSISAETVRTHKKRIYAKAGVHSHEELVRRVREAR